MTGLSQVSSDEEALKLMNDSKYGLTASVWTDAKNPASVEAFERLADEIEGAFAPCADRRRVRVIALAPSD
jgi:acyl-CoA reductase-like NAD-dependent aldehyde dehydrogenase